MATSWVKACALFTASGMSETELEAITAALESTTVGTDEEQIVHETLAALERRRLDLV